MGYRRRRLSVCAASNAILVSFVSVVSFISFVSTSKQASAASATVLWTAPGDDGMAGRASQYALRISASPISGTDTTSWWNAATIVNTAGTIPGISGSLDSLVLTGLTSGTRYYAIVRTADEVPNWSRFSNVVAIVAVDNLATVVGTVREASTGIAVGGALVREGVSGASATTLANGTYSLSAPAGTLIISATKSGYSPGTSSIVAGAGSTKTLDFSLVKVPTGTLAGTVVRTTDGSVVSDAEISLVGTTLVATTGADGKYALAAPPGTVSMRCERPGFKPSTQIATISNGQTKTVNFSVAPAAFYDDAQTDKGWSLSTAGDDATTGTWVRVAPVGTTTGSVAVQPSFDHTPGAGTACFVTGNGTKASDIGEADVDGGRTTLTSPLLRMAGMSDPRIVFWRWYSNNASDYPGEDPFVTQISNNGGPWVTVSNLYTTSNYWERVEIPVASYFTQPADVRIRFVAMDIVNPSVVEAAIDDVEFYSATMVTAVTEEGAPAFVIGAPRPSPSSGPTEINLELPKATSVAADVFNVQGRRVRTLERRIMPAGRHILRWDGRLDQGGSAASGVYWIRIGAGGVERNFKLVVVR